MNSRWTMSLRIFLLASVILLPTLIGVAEAQESTFVASASTTEAKDAHITTDVQQSYPPLDVALAVDAVQSPEAGGGVTVESAAAECVCLGKEIKEVGISCLVINGSSEQVVVTIEATGYTGTLKMRARAQKSIILGPNSAEAVNLHAPIEGALWGCDSVGDCGCKKVKAYGALSKKPY